MILERETYFSNSLPKRAYLFIKKFFYILFRFLGRPNWGRLEAGVKVEGEKKTLILTEGSQGDLQCTSCQICVEICPTRCLEVNAPKNKAYPVLPAEFFFEENLCIYCDLCVDVCPEDAIAFVGEGEYAFVPKIDLVKNHAKSLS